MSRLAKFFVMSIIFILVLSTGGAGQQAAAAPLSGPIGRTGMTQPSEIFAPFAIDDTVIIPFGDTSKHYWFATNNISVFTSAPVKFPKGKVARWVKAWVTDGDGATNLCIQPFFAQPATNTATKIGAAVCSSGSSGLVEVLKTTFSQKVKGSNFIGVYINTIRTSHHVLGIQGGFVK